MTVISLFDRWQLAELARRKDKGAEVRRAFGKDVFPAIGIALAGLSTACQS